MTSKAKKPAAAKPAAKTIKAPKPPVVYKNVKRWEGGVREATQKAIPAKGATFEQLKKATKFPEHKLLGYVNCLAAKKYISRHIDA